MLVFEIFSLLSVYSTTFIIIKNEKIKAILLKSPSGASPPYQIFSIALTEKVNIKIELDNVQVLNFNINALTPGYTHDYKNISLNSKTPGAVHNIKITGTKTGTTKVASRSITFPTQEDLNKIEINFTHRETNPPRLLTDTFRFTNISATFGAVRFAVDEEEITDTSTLYEINSIETIPNNDSKKHTIKYRYKYK